MIAAVALMTACGPPDSVRTARDQPRDEAPSDRAEPDESSCEPAEVRALDTARVLELALASIREASGDAPSACADAAPACAGPADGARCVYELSLYPDVVRVVVRPRAEDGALVEGEAFVARDLSGIAAPARVGAQRWAVSGPVRCRGESAQRSYGAGGGPVAATEIGVTCHSADERPFRITGVTMRGPRPIEAQLTGFEPSTLAAGETRVRVTFAPVPLALRTDNAFQVTLEAGEHTLRPVAQVVTPERRRLR